MSFPRQNLALLMRTPAAYSLLALTVICAGAFTWLQIDPPVEREDTSDASAGSRGVVSISPRVEVIDSNADIQGARDSAPAADRERPKQRFIIGTPAPQARSAGSPTLPPRTAEAWPSLIARAANSSRTAERLEMPRATEYAASGLVGIGSTRSTNFHPSALAVPVPFPVPQFPSAPTANPPLVVELSPGVQEPAALLEHEGFLSQQQEDAKDEVAREFGEEISAVAADPASEESLDEAWSDARLRADARYRLLFGDMAFNQASAQAAREALASRPVQ